MSLLQQKPALPLDVAADLARSRFGIEGAASPLPGERDQNVRIDAVDGRRFVLKIAHPADDASLLEAQHVAMAAAAPLSPRPVPGMSGRFCETKNSGSSFSTSTEVEARITSESNTESPFAVKM